MARIWIKQFGLERSGTNYAKALVEMSCPDVRVLATVLGSKHALPELDHHVDLLDQGDIGIAITDLVPSEFPDIVSAYRDASLAVMICVRDAVTWIDAYERHMARRQKRDEVILDRDHLRELAHKWINWIYDMTDWAERSGLRHFWVGHHQAVRRPQSVLDQVVALGAACGDAAEVGYLRKAGDHHGSENVTGRPYRTRQYREIYAGNGQITGSDVEWLVGVIGELDVRGIADRFMWDRKPLRRKARR